VIVVRPETIALASSRLATVLALQITTRTAADSAELRQLIRRMASENPLWGESACNELLLKLSICVSPRTVRKYMPVRPPGHPRGDQRWSTFLHNHAGDPCVRLLRCGHCDVQLLYVFVVIEHSARQLVHINVTANPSRLDAAAVAGGGRE
jgi:hypothetical protein